MAVVDFSHNIFYWSGIALHDGDWVLVNFQARVYIGVENKTFAQCIKGRTVYLCIT